MSKVVSDVPLLVEIQNYVPEQLYNEAIQHGIKEFQFMFAALFCGGEELLHNNPERWAVWLHILPAGVQHVVERITKNGTVLANEDWDAYMSCINSLRFFTKKEAVIKLALLALDFSWQQTIEAAWRILQQDFPQASWCLYSKIPAEEISNPAEFWYRTGKCLWQLQQYDMAAERLRMAQAAGCMERDVAAYLAWMP